MPRSPLHQYHQELGARFVDFGGWEMPVLYTSVLKEHRAVREATGWFDVSHLGRFSWSGDGHRSALSVLLCNDHERIGPGRAQYTLILNSGGGVIDDLIIWKRTSQEVMVMPNGGNHLRVMEAFRAVAPNAELVDLRPLTASLAVQGPDSRQAVEAVLGEVPGHFRVTRTEFRGGEVWVAGTGYTGEQGVELVTDPSTAEALARQFTGAGALPCGQWTGCHSTPIDAGAPPHGDRKLTDKTNRLSYPFGVLVNAEGRRFFDEGVDFQWYTYAKLGGIILNQPGGLAWQIFDAKTVPLLEGRYATSRPLEADTVADLVAQLDVDRPACLRTLEEYNDSTGDDGFDPTRLDGLATRALGLSKSNWAQRIDKPPFVAYPVTGGITFTFGGLRIDDRARVVDVA